MSGLEFDVDQFKYFSWSILVGFFVGMYQFLTRRQE